MVRVDVQNQHTWPMAGSMAPFWPSWFDHTQAETNKQANRFSITMSARFYVPHARSALLHIDVAVHQSTVKRQETKNDNLKTRFIGEILGSFFARPQVAHPMVPC